MLDINIASLDLASVAPASPETEKLIIGPKSFEKCFQHKASVRAGAASLSSLISIRGDTGWRKGDLLAANSDLMYLIIWSHSANVTTCDPITPMSLL